MIKLFICAPKINQSVKIATEKIKEIFQLFPLLEQEVINGGNFSKDYVRLIFRNGSIFDVVSTQESQRGGRRNAGLIDEIRRLCDCGFKSSLIAGNSFARTISSEAS